METAKQQIGHPKTGSADTEKLGRDRTLSDRVYEEILTMIVSGEIPVGAKLPTEHALSQQLEVSRPVLRQALKQLREDGVIVSRQGSGSFVERRPEGAFLDFAPVGSIADIQRTFEFRAAIEGEAAYLAAERRTDAELANLRAAAPLAPLSPSSSIPCHRRSKADGEYASMQCRDAPQRGCGMCFECGLAGGRWRWRRSGRLRSSRST